MPPAAPAEFPGISSRKFVGMMNGLSMKVSDTGTGIGPENMKKLFEPFFTIKPGGKGPARGLW
mgnify:CR=1 FL=1